MGEQKSPYPYDVNDVPRELSDQDLHFLSRYTGENDLDKLREHVLSVWRAVKAQSWVFGCIQRLLFLEPRIGQHEHFPHILEVIKSGRPMQVLDVGCCFGQDARQLLLDGLPEDNLTVTDLTNEYWEFGKRLFMDANRMEQGENCGVQACFGSFTDAAFVSPEPPVGPLGRLAGRVDVLWAGAVLHVLCKQNVERFVRHAHGMLAPGGVWIGTCGGSEEPGEWFATPDGTAKRYLHSPASLTQLMRAAGFSEVSANLAPALYSGLEQPPPDDGSGRKWLMMMYTAKK